MLIMSNNNRAFYDSSKFAEFSAADRAVFAVMSYSAGQVPTKIAFYQTREQCEYALGLLYQAIIAGDAYFEFPHVDDLQERMTVAHQHRSKVTSRKVGHGGS